MKLAREIAEAVFRDDMSSFRRNQLESFIAAKLELVAEALTEGRIYCPQCDRKIPDHMEGCPTGNALALLGGGDQPKTALARAVEEARGGSAPTPRRGFA